MKVIRREIQERIVSGLVPGKVQILLGTRRVGKTFLLRMIAEQSPFKILSLNGEDFHAQQLLAESSIANYRSLLANTELLIIDEAQAVPGIGAKLKLIVDEVPGIRVLVSGSSSFDLLNKSGEPLTGRSRLFHLHPFSQAEFSVDENPLDTKQKLNERLVYGAYPEVAGTEMIDEKKDYLRDLVNAYLLKDILHHDGIRGSSKMMDILRLLSLQVGKEVSYHELGLQLGLSKNTVEKYLDLLTKVFIIFPLGGFSRNLRKEISKSNKWFFFDNGIRNAVISKFESLPLRSDTGELWENYMISEKIKRNSNQNGLGQFYFWRTYDQQEIDLVETQGENIATFEIKWGSRKVTVPAAFRKAYPDAGFRVITPENYLEGLL